MATNAGSSLPGDLKPGAGDPSSLSGLVSSLLTDVTGLFRNELRLAKAEASDALAAVKAGVGGVALAGAIMFSGVLALLAAAILALAEVLDPWLAALIVGLAMTLVGYGLLQGARKKLTPPTFSLDRTQESLRKDAALVGGERR
jgi:hypothetical protein